jgi:hypothetical protein
VSIPSRFVPIIEAAYKGNLQEGEALSFDHIIAVAQDVAQTKGYVQYSDYDVDLLIEVLNGTWPPSSLGFRLQNIRYALMQRQWRSEGRPVKFFPPR